MQRGVLVLWVPVCLAFGVGGYFLLMTEPVVPHYVAALLLILVCVLLAGLVPEVVSPVVMAAALIAVGGVLAGLRAHSVAGPVLGFRYYGPVEGRIVAIDRSASDKVRLTLDHVVLARMAPSRVPHRVRVSLHSDQSVLVPEPGMTILLTAHLSPPGGPVEPGGFDFGRHAWFNELGAVGYTRSPVLLLETPRIDSFAMRVFRVRMALSTAIQARLDGQTGALAAAIMTGDRSGINQDVLRDLRRSNLAHLLAISGLHMGLLTGLIFVAVRIGFCLFPFAALRLPVKKIAAVSAIFAGLGYLVLSGGSVSTQRAYVMALVMFCAVLLGRRAISLRAVAIAATIILVWRPESLTGPGFQMSFAATVGLVAVFGWLRHLPQDRWRLPNWAKPVGAVVTSSAVAGFATAPYSAAHFNQIADMGLIANLLSVPLMGVLVMPAAIVAAALSVVGLEQIGLTAMGWGLKWILGVSHWVAAMDGSVTKVIAPGPWVLPLLTIGALFLILWRGKWRFAGLAGVVSALALWSLAERPTVLISSSGGLVGVMTSQGRAINKPRGDGFAAQSWLENDGDVADQWDASARSGFSGEKGDLTVQIGPVRVRHMSGRNLEMRAETACGDGILILTKAIEPLPKGPCTLITPKTLAQSGALSLSVGKEGKLLVRSARDMAGVRLWTGERQ